MRHPLRQPPHPEAASLFDAKILPGPAASPHAKGNAGRFGGKGSRGCAGTDRRTRRKEAMLRKGKSHFGHWAFFVVLAEQGPWIESEVIGYRTTCSKTPDLLSIRAMFYYKLSRYLHFKIASISKLRAFRPLWTTWAAFRGHSVKMNCSRCPPLLMKRYKDIEGDNYMNESHFLIEPGYMLTDKLGYKAK